MSTYASIFKYIRLQLGAPTIKVELDEDQSKACVDHALDVLGTYRPTEKFGVVDVLPTVQMYTISAANVGKGIIELFKPPLLQSPLSLDQFDVFKYHTNLPNLDPGDFMMERVWWKEVRVSAGSDDDWECNIDPETGEGKLYISPKPSQSMKVYYVYVTDPTLANLSPSDDDWVKDYSLGMAMQIVGRVRRKFGGVKGSESSIDMDGSDLVTEGKELIEKQMGYIENRGAIVPPLRG